MKGVGVCEVSRSDQMDMKYISFRGKIEILDFGRMSYSVINLPDSVLKNLPEKKTGLRLQGEINKIPFSLAIQHYGTNYQIIMIKKLLREAHAAVGDSVEVDFKVVDKEIVDVPFEVLEALNADAKFKAKWEKLTPGKKRSYIHPINQAKRPETKEKRLNELMKELKRNKEI